jgi:hypothetical protein
MLPEKCIDDKIKCRFGVLMHSTSLISKEATVCLQFEIFSNDDSIIHRNTFTAKRTITEFLVGETHSNINGTTRQYKFNNCFIRIPDNPCYDMASAKETIDINGIGKYQLDYVLSAATSYGGDPCGDFPNDSFVIITDNTK